jgi:hypothetical protein
MTMKTFSVFGMLMAITFLAGNGAKAAMPISSPWLPGDTWQGAGSCGGSYYHEGNYHDGTSEYAIDFNRHPACSSDRGYPIVASKAGIIVFSGWRSGFGNCVEIDHGSYQGKNTKTFYAHLLDGGPFAVQGESVNQSCVVGLCGKTGGTSTGEHLHFEERENNQSVRITSMDGYSWCDPSCDGHVQTSRNTTLLDQAYDRNGGAPKIGNREYDMWDLAHARAANPNHPWYNAWNPNSFYFSDKTPKNCIIQHLNGGYYWDSAIVYDGLGGARRAYVLHSGFWIRWTNDGGPLSPFRMPITDEYSQGAGRARQDCQGGYLYYHQGSNPEITYNPYPVCAPGMTASGWNPQVSYRIADIYASRADPRSYWGEATQFAYKSGSVWKQRFQSGRTIEVPETYSLPLAPPSPPAIALGQDGEEINTPSLQPVSLSVSPNPMRSTCAIIFDLALPQTTVVSVFDVQGRQVRLLAPSQFRFPGQTALTWDGKMDNGVQTPMGIYYLRLVTPNQSITAPITVVR